MATENKEQVLAAEVAAAVYQGAKNAINDKIIKPLSKLIEPGDMNPEHMPHPLNELAAKSANLPDQLAKAYEPKDMNPEHMPHPVDNTLVAANEKVATIKAAGTVKGTQIAAELVVGAIIDSADPLKKVKLADNVLDAATDVSKVRRVEGHLVDDVVPDKGLVTSAGVEESKTGLAKFKEQATGLKNKALDFAENIPVVGDLVAPSLDKRILRQAHNEKPGLLDAMDEKHRIGGDPDVMYAQHDDKLLRAQALADQVRGNPEAAAINRRVTDADISSLLNRSTNEQLGLPQNPDAIPKLPSPEQQIVINARQAQLDLGKQQLADELAYQDTLSPAGKLARKIYIDNANPETGLAIGLSRYGGTIKDHLSINAAGLESEQLGIMAKAGARGAAQVLGGSVLAVAAATHDWRSDEEKNADLSKSFLNAVERGTEQGFKELVASHKELAGAAFQYQTAKNGLIGADGKLSEQEAASLAEVATKMAKKIETEGPQVFDKPPQNLSYNEVVQQREVASPERG